MNRVQKALQSDVISPAFVPPAMLLNLKPANAQGAIVARLNTEINAVLQLPDVRVRLASLSDDAGGGGLGGVSATLAAARLGLRLTLVGELDLLGGQ